MKEINLSTKIAVYPLEECSENEKKLIASAKSAAENAYAPYSGFKVGAAVLLSNGEIISGNNQENAAYPSGLCAERVALFYAQAKQPNEKIKAIAVAARQGDKFSKNIVAPCGACRQSLLEAENRSKGAIKVLIYSGQAVYVVNSIKELLPLGFSDSLLRDDEES